jgi:hypothetical protein
MSSEKRIRELEKEAKIHDELAKNKEMGAFYVSSQMAKSNYYRILASRLK